MNYLLIYMLGYIVYLSFKDITFFELKHLPIFILGFYILVFDWFILSMVYRIILSLLLGLIVGDFTDQFWAIIQKRRQIRQLKQTMDKFFNDVDVHDELNDLIQKKLNEEDNDRD